ncbi:hypothetical protein GGH12_003213 [Coemansia sp. RSA 1822]|nr:hypothetical protein LPJ76_003450 [Coemansia sp. RSA 638]KAJ2542238.1 hypothetical protein GGF49_003039 [Coemansia sp. RSA 1853]KAJ2562435.1 hypothetical protein GGH12_003213 [Coemansia sp. RSA 1822]
MRFGALVSFGLALVSMAAGAPVSGKTQQLDAATFSEQTRTGTWIVKHYSPSCKHCRKFQPKWEQIVATNALDVKFAELDCKANSDLCDSHGVESWPTVVSFKNGKRQEQLVGDETFDNLAAFVRSAAPANTQGSVVLAAGNFTEHAHKGVWLVKHYSPFCPHCQHMAPEWTKVTNELSGVLGTDNVRFGEVNCIENRRLCEENLVDGYPTVNLFVDGKFVEEMLLKYEYGPMKEYMLKLPLRVRSGELAAKKAEPVVANDNRDWDDAAADDEKKPGDIVEVKAEVPEVKADTPEVKADTPEVKADTPKTKADTPAAVNVVESKTDAPAIEVKSEPTEQYNLDGEVVVLTKENFAERTAAGPWFVEFYAPWCPHCQHLAPEWDRLSVVMRGKVNIGKVNCDDAGKLCSQQNVQGFPTLKMLWEGESSVYKGPRDLDNMQSFIDGMLTQPRVIADADQMKQMQQDNDVVFMFHGSASHQAALARVTTNVRKMFMAGRLGIVREAALANELAGSTLKVPSLTAFKDGQVVVYSGSLGSDDQIREWLYAERFPLLPEFTRENADSLFYDSDYLVLGILPTDQASEAVSKVRNTVRDAAVEYQKWHDTKAPHSPATVRFAWIDGPKWESYVDRVFRIPRTAWPAVVIVQSSEDNFFTTDIRGQKIDVSKMGVFMAVRAALDGKLTAQSTKSIIVRAAKAIGRTTVAVWSFFFGSMFSALVTLSGIVVLGYYLFVRTTKRSRSNSFNLVKAD